MAGDKTLQKFCNLSKYIKQVDKDLFCALEDLCLLKLLMPRQGSGGITFLLPKGKGYRDKIMANAWGKNPEIAISMIKALILQDNYKTLASLGAKQVINALQLKVEFSDITDKEAKIGKEIVLTPDTKYIPLGYYDNITVYTMTGKGDLPITGERVAFEPRVSAPMKGGAAAAGDLKTLQDFIANNYARSENIGKSENIYVKKCQLQLKYIFDKGEQNMRIRTWLGNDEFSDSYLLDIYCQIFYPDVFPLILEIFTNFFADTMNMDRASYLAIKASFLDGVEQPHKSSNRAQGITSPIDIRDRVCEAYKSQYKDTECMHHLGKDLFIVFCNLSKDIWFNENQSNDRISSFENFAYLASNVYNETKIITQQGFDVALDMTLYGNLLKSDVFKFEPSTTLDTSLPVPTTMPSPLDMTLYSLCGFTNKQTSKVGGMSAVVMNMLKPL